jgi:hypothetical protein
MMNLTGTASFILLTLLCFTSSLSSVGRANVGVQQSSRLKRIYPELRTRFLRHYPQVTSHLLNGRIHFEQDTRIFIVHEPLKTGEWQDPSETRGPNLGGVLCDIELRDGKYNGAASVPQTFDKRYFKVLIMSPYSSKHNAHLYTHLSYPSNVSDEFLKEFTEVVNSFDKYLD